MDQRLLSRTAIMQRTSRSSVFNVPHRSSSRRGVHGHLQHLVDPGVEGLWRAITAPSSQEGEPPANSWRFSRLSRAPFRRLRPLDVQLSATTKLSRPTGLLAREFIHSVLFAVLRIEAEVRVGRRDCQAQPGLTERSDCRDLLGVIQANHECSESDTYPN